MCSLLAAAFVAHWDEWRTQITPSDEWIPAGAFMAILSALLIVSVLGLFSTLAAASSSDETRYKLSQKPRRGERANGTILLPGRGFAPLHGQSAERSRPPAGRADHREPA
jgi:hypothetical protein